MLGWLSLKNCRNSKIVLQNSLPTVHLMRPFYRLFVRFNGLLLWNLLILNLRKWFSDLSARSLRNAEVNLRLPLLESAGEQKCFSYRGAKLWNSLGTEAKNSSTLRAFKREVQKGTLKPFSFYFFFIFDKL